MNSAFCRCHPAVNFIFFLGAAVLAMMFVHPLFLLISLAGALTCAVRFKGRSALKTFFFALLPLVAFVVLVNSLFAHYGVTEVFTLWNGNKITLESIAYGAATGTLVVIMMLWFMCYSEAVTEDKFMHVFGKKMPNLSLLILMVLRFVPLYTNQLRDVLSVRESAGLNSENGRLSKIKNATAAMFGVITWALEHSIETADSMKSRGYGLKGRTSYSRFTVAPSDVVLIISEIIAILIVVAVKISGEIQAVYNPEIQISGVSPVLIFSAIIYTLFCFLPVIFDLEEEIRWNRLYAKI